MLQHGVHRLSVPLLAAGRDRLPWEDVERLLDVTFRHSGITVYIFTL